ncbi:MAG: DegV family protein, partial [Lachnospiraceae bacterium]|nr:DegV family protein [Lachnospiraceae bacterium]
IYIMLDTLHYLKKGGRITPAAAALGTLLRLKPVLQIQGEKLDAFAKARTTAQGKSIMINAIKADIENRFGGMEAGDFLIAGAYTNNLEIAQEWKKEVEAAFPGHEMHMDPLSLSVGCHIGPGALAVTVQRKLHV